MRTTRSVSRPVSGLTLQQTTPVALDYQTGMSQFKELAAISNYPYLGELPSIINVIIGN
jgi:hypothetical protein